MAGVTLITEPEQLKPLEAEWRRLAEERGNAFVTPEWYGCWLRHFGAEAGPFVPAVLDEDGALRGLLPLVLAKRGRARVCRLAGAPAGDHFHPVARAEDEVAVAGAAGEAIAAHRQRWSIVKLERVEQLAPWVERLELAIGAGLRTFRGAPAILPSIDLSRYSGWEDYLASRSKNFRSSLRRRLRKAHSRHRVRYRLTEHPSELDEDMATLFRLHDARFGQRSSLRGRRLRSFHRDFAAAALERGWLRLSFLEFDGVAVAAEYGWRIGDRHGLFNGGFDPAYSSLSPGTMIQAMVLQGAFEEGAGEFDLLLGDEEYKLRFADRSRRANTVTMAKPRPMAQALAGAEHVARRAARVLPSRAREASLVRAVKHSLFRGSHHANSLFAYLAAYGEGVV